MKNVAEQPWLNKASIDLWLVGAVALGAFLRFSRIGDFDNDYYTATVASMLESLHNFLFASFDSAGVVMVDKPPFSFWVQTLPAAILGVNSWTVTLPQAIVGTVSVALLYVAIRPVFGRVAAIVASLVLAVLPASVVIDSGNEPDSLLSFILLLAGLSIIRAVQTGKWSWLITFGVLMGLAFNTKMLVAFIPLPVFLLYYVLSAKIPIPQLAKRTIVTILVLLVVSLSWVTFVAVTPADDRPYVGSTPDNSIQTLVIKYNGLNRFTSFIGPRVQQRPPQAMNQAFPQEYGAAPAFSGQVPPGGMLPGQPPAMDPDAPTNGLMGLLANPLANQMGWLLPVGLITLALTLTPLLQDDVYRRPRTLPNLLRDSSFAAQALLWGGWLGTGLLVFGVANSTTTHPYYLVGVAVPLAATLGIGGSVLVKAFSRGNLLSWLVMVALIGSAGYQAWGANAAVAVWIISLVLAGILASVLIMGIGLSRKLQNEPLALGAFAAGALALLVIPLAVSMTTGGRIAGPALRTPPAVVLPRPAERDLETARLQKFLNSRTTDSTVTLGTFNAREAAPFIIDGIPSVAIGGFSGNDPIFSLDSFRTMARTEGPQYFLFSELRPNRMRRAIRQEPIQEYIRMNWRDISDIVGLPPRSLYANPHSKDASKKPRRRV